MTNKLEKKRHVLVAKVVSSIRAYEGTLVVTVTRIKTVGKMKKQVVAIKRYTIDYALKQPIAIGTPVEISPCRPKSKTKRYEFIGVVK